VFRASTSATKSNSAVTRYGPSCNHAVVVPSCLSVAHTTTTPASSASSASSRDLLVSKRLTLIVLRLSTSSILPPSGACRFAVADSDATVHMFPDKSAFISYKLVADLQVRMGNNSFLPVLGHGSAIISLNWQRILVRHALHVLGLVVPLYSLRAHCLQPGCGFIGAEGVGILVYFPSFVLTVDAAKDCHLGFDSLGGLAPLESLHYVQPCCMPSLYPSDLASHTASKHRPLLPPPAVVEDDGSASDDAASANATWTYPQPKCPSSPQRSPASDPVDFASGTAQFSFDC
jgi:hypothetical protein